MIGYKISNRTKSGAMWVTFVAILSMPLAYYRNWILGRIGSTGEFAGCYALLLLYIQLISTFVFYGGSNVLTNFLPKMLTPQNKSSFLFTYSFISLIIVAIFILIINLFPEAYQYITKYHFDKQTIKYFSFLAPLIVLSNLVIFTLSGLMEFKLSSIISQFHLYLICLFGTLAAFSPKVFFTESPLLFSCFISGIADFLIIVIGFKKIKQLLPDIIFKFFLPKNFWNFSSFVHLNTIITFIYTSIDQIFVFSKMGTSELGAYFILLQCAQLIRFVPTKIGQVLLSTFSNLIVSGNYNDLKIAYIKLSRFNVILCTILSIMVILFSRQIASFFGICYADKYIYLIFLSCGMHIGSLGSINSMLIIAKEKTDLFLFNNIALITAQFLFTIIFIDKYGIYSILIGKLIGIITGQIGLFSIIRWKLKQIKLLPPKEYWISLLPVIAASLFSLIYHQSSIILIISVFFFLVFSFLFLVNFQFYELKSILIRH